MKRLLTLTCVALISFTGAYAASGDEGVRIRKTINKEWTFNYFPSPDKAKGVYEDPSFDDSSWSIVSVPHTWQTYETTRELHPYIRNAAASDDPYWWNGWGWYRKHIIIGEQYRGRRVRFEFDGVQKYSEVYLNGKLLDTHCGGFTSFYADATDAVRFGGDNVLVVAVNNSLNDPHRIPPMNAGNWVVYGGIIRDVRVVLTDPVNIPFQGSWKHEGGTFVITRQADENNAVISIDTHVWNQDSKDHRVMLKTTILNPKGKVVAKAREVKQLKEGELSKFNLLLPRIRKPQLWSFDTPSLYMAKSEVFCDGKAADNYVTFFGIRTVSWDFDAHRLVLNGKIVHLHGINRHEEYPWLGHAFPKWVALRDMDDMKHGLDINYMRTAHYPNDPVVYDFMDRNGIAIDEELPNIKNQDFSDEVQERNCREMIRRDRNHPCIVLWSMGNETNKACDSRFAVQEDTTRVITVRQPYNDSYNPAFCRHTDKEMPVESYLRCTIRGWYDRDDRNLEPSDGQWAGTEYWQHRVSRGKEERPISEHNGTVWLYADHGADREYTDAPLKHVNPKGWVDSWRNPKYIYYLWQANFSRKPMVHIQPHFWRSRYLGQKKMITVDSNCETVTLLVNGKEIGSAKPSKANDFCVEFNDVEIVRGEIRAVAKHRDGTVVSDSVVMSGEPAALTISAYPSFMEASVDNILEVKVDIVDKDGVHVIGANNTLKFQVSGPAKLVGPEVYVSDRDKHEEFEGTMYIDAPAANVIRSTGKPGKVTVSVHSPGLKSAEISIDVREPIEERVAGIEEPLLNTEGRLPVAVNTEEANFIPAPAVLKEYAGEVSFPIAQRAGFRTLMDDFVKGQNPGLDAGKVEYSYLLDALCAILESTADYTSERGYVVADDYNFLVNRFNTSCAITGHIDALSLPQEYKDFMKARFADKIVRQGNDRNPIAVCKAFDGIPSETLAVKVDASCDLVPLVQKAWPGAVERLSKDEQKKAFRYMVAVNPDVTGKSIRNRETKERTNRYDVVRPSVVLIPNPEIICKLPEPEKIL